jgi:Toprim-like
MDAATLWDAGITNVVATMGTAVSTQQLDLAAKTAGVQAGRIVFCMDNDKAGVAAVERLCRNGMLADCAKKHAVAIAIATLPDGIKDPADFVEMRRATGAGDKVADDFRSEIVDGGVDWTDWFMQRVIIGAYTDLAPSGAPGSFTHVFDEMADFFASSLHPADRLRRTHNALDLLCGILTQETNQTDVSTAVRMQLEADFLDAIKRCVDAKVVMRDMSGMKLVKLNSNGDALTALARGYGPTSHDEESKFSKSARTVKETHNVRRQATQSKKTDDIRKHNTTRAILKRQKETSQESLIPHFAGFQFTHDTDKDWLQLDKKEKVSGTRTIDIVCSIS